MGKVKTAVVTNNLDLQIDIKNLLVDDDIIVNSFMQYDDLTVIKLLGQSPDVIILVNDDNNNVIFETANMIYTKSVCTGLVIMSDKIDNDLLVKAMECGVKQVVPLNISSKGLKESVFKAYSIELQKVGEHNKERPFSGKVISYFGGKGGTGKTTVSVNAAVELARIGKKVVLLDFDLQFGDVTVLLDIEPKDTVYTLVEEKTDISIDALKSVLSFHRSGLEVLAAPKSPEFAEYITENTIEKIVNVLRPYYDYIIIDLPPGFNDATIAAIENSDVINLVSSVDIASLRNAKVCLGILEALKQNDKVCLILNRMTDGIISKKDFVSILNLEIVLILNDDTKTVLSSLNKGVPFVMEKPKLSISKAIKEYVSTL